MTSSGEIRPVAVVILERESRVLVRRRPRSDALLGGLWEFPGGKIEPGEDPDAAAAREVLEETGLEVTELAPFAELEHRYPDRRVHLHFFLGTATGPARAPWEWRRCRDLSADEWPEANRAVVERLVAERR